MKYWICPKYNQIITSLDKTDFRISETIKAVVNRLTYHIENKKLCIEVDYKDDLWVYADERRIEQVII